MPYVKTKIPRSITRNGNSLKGAARASAGIFLGTGLALGRMVSIATICKAKMKNAAIRMAQGYPVLGFWTSRLSMIGKITPPTDEPVTVMPIATPRFCENQVEMHTSTSDSISMDDLVTGRGPDKEWIKTYQAGIRRQDRYHYTRPVTKGIGSMSLPEMRRQ
jgi:hypothetical protein